MTCGAGTARRARRGFTLIELVVVISLIVLLAALVLGVGMAVRQNAEKRQTEVVLQLLDAAVQEWEANSDRQVTYGVSNPGQGVYFEIEQDDNEAVIPGSDRITDRLLEIISRPEPVRNILANIDPDMTAREEHSPGQFVQHYYDAWGERIYAVLPGREWFQGDSYPRDADGSIQTPIETALGVVQNRRICFISAGPDGKFGNVGAQGTPQQRAEAADNVYSYAPSAD